MALDMNFLEIVLCPGLSPFDSHTCLFIIDVHKCTKESVCSTFFCSCRRFYISKGVSSSILENFDDILFNERPVKSCHHESVGKTDEQLR